MTAVYKTLVAQETTLAELRDKLVPTPAGIKVDGSGATQPISAVALPLPLGAATALLQTAGSAILATINSFLSSLDTTLQALLGRYTASQSVITASAVVTTSSVKILAANPNRKGLFIYNNSANSGYIALGSTASSANNMTALVATFATWTMPQPIYTGDIYAIRNAGTGNFLVTELT